jgi:hypothetical protein
MLSLRVFAGVSPIPRIVAVAIPATSKGRLSKLYLLLSQYDAVDEGVPIHRDRSYRVQVEDGDDPLRARADETHWAIATRAAQPDALSTAPECPSPQES